jgi:integration host factor beta subunit
MPQQAALEESIKQRIEGASGDDRLSATKESKAGRDPPHHIFQTLVDLGDVVAKGLFKQRLRAKIVPKAMHLSLVANRLAELFQKTLHQLVAALARGDRVEVRGFGAFSVKHRPARSGRNPRTGEHVPVDQKSVPFFKTGKEMRERLNKANGEDVSH